MRISHWSSDVCSSDLNVDRRQPRVDLRYRIEVAIGELGFRGKIVGPVAVELGDERLDRTRIGIPLRVERNIAARSAQVREDRLGQIGRASCRERVCQYV